MLFGLREGAAEEECRVAVEGWNRTLDLEENGHFRGGDTTGYSHATLRPVPAWGPELGPLGLLRRKTGPLGTAAAGDRG
jgi:hypothetical protein